MHRYTRLLLTSLAATAIMALALSSASARNLSVNSANFRVTWASLNLANNLGFPTVSCPVTLEGTFHRQTITKVPNTLIGYITRAIVNGARPPCTGGTATIKNETLPWHLTYTGFRGTLPRITEVDVLLVGAGFAVTTGETTCTAKTETRQPAGGILTLGAEGRVTGLVADPTRQITLVGGLCVFGRGNFSGTGTVTQLGNSTPITITLI